jgi:hypothetical protein
MTSKNLIDLIKLRVAVGYLGEREQNSWWQSAFFSASSAPFLAPVFGKTSLTAQYYGVREAATLIHDDHIGTGAEVFHLFRLPENIEQEMHAKLGDSDLESEIHSIVASQESAITFLNEFKNSSDTQAIGPVRLGTAAEISKPGLWKKTAGYYSYAMQNSEKTFPYVAKN